MPAAYKITEESHVTGRRSALETRLQRQKKVMREIDLWRHLDALNLESTIYQGIPAKRENPRKVIVAPNAYAVTNTCVALAATNQPKFDAIPVDQTAAQMLRAANVVERIGYAMYYTMSKERPLELTAESSEHAFGRGVHIYKYAWMTPEERGEVRVQQPVMVQLPGIEQPPQVEQVVEQGSFPVLVQVLDPLDCWWALGKDGRVTEFIHEYKLAWDELVDLYPDCINDPDFESLRNPGGGESIITVLDYWNQDINCILFNQKFYKKPTKHSYPKVPVIVEMANVRIERDRDSRTATPIATPICWPMIPALTWASWTASLMATYLQFSVIQSYVLKGVNSNQNPHLERDPQTGAEKVNLEVDFSQGSVLMIYDNEDFRPIIGADVTPMMQRFLQTMDSYMAMTGMSEPILTGVYPVEPNSGYATVQQRFSTMARIQDTLLSLSRGLSRLMTDVTELIVSEWDYGDSEMVLSDLMATRSGLSETTMQITKEMFSAVREFNAEINPEVPINDEQTKAAIFQAISAGVLSRYRAIEQLHYAPDPDEELKRIMAESFAMQNPQMLQALANQWLKEQGVDVVAMAQQQQAQAAQQQAQQQPMNAPSSPSSQGMAGPATPQPEQPAMSPAGGNGQMDPAMFMAAIQQAQQGQGVPPQGG